MMRVDYIKDSAKTPGSKIKIAGRVSRVKELKSGRFIWVRDITGVIQVTALKEKIDTKLLKVAEELAPNYFVLVEGTVPEKIQSALGAEIIPSKIQIISKPMAAATPIDIEGGIETSVDKRLDWRALDLRNPKQAAIFVIQSKLMEGFQKFLYSHKFMQTFTPSLMGSTAEGGSEVFSLKHFGKNAFLRQDPQLHRQLLMLAGFEKIYEIGPSWRAEQSNTPFHMTEHRTCAAEMSFIDNESDVMRVEEEMVASAVKGIITECEEELKLFDVDLKAPKTPFPVLEFPAIYDILEEKGFKPKRGEEDYDKKGETTLCEYAKEKYKSDFVFINRFPFAIKPFYVMRVDDDPTYARSTDLLYKGLELSSGGQREHRYEKIIEQIKIKGYNLESLKWFTEFFRYGAPPHGGFSLGIERFTMKLLGIQNVREATLFPRTPDRLIP